MKRGLLIGLAGMLLIGCGKKESTLELDYPGYEGETVELISFTDSTILKSGVVNGGKIIFDNSDCLSDGPVLGQVMIDGRVKGFFVLEEGKAVLSDTMSVARGTALNDMFSIEIRSLDSVENLNDMIAYASFAKRKYEENSTNVLGDYFGVEYLKYGEPKSVLEMVSRSPKRFKESKRVQRFIRYAELRSKTSVGEPYADFTVVQEDGKEEKLSGYINKGGYTLVDFWASWCPYCIKELPELKEMYSRYRGKGLEIVGVAVRDSSSDTESSVKKHGIEWPVLKNAQKIPYDVYGFSGIPHLILIGPDGKIISRGESAAQTMTRLKGIFGE